MITFLVLALAIPASMLAQQGSKAEKEVRAVIDELQKANLKGGAEGAVIFDKYLADDLTRIPANGAVLTKADLVNGFKTGKIKVDALELSDIKIRIYGHTAVATGISTRKETNMGARVAGGTRWTRVFVKRDGVWKNVLYQNTGIPEPAKQ
jgi:hypothetical protein